MPAGMPLLGAPQEVAEEGRPDVPSGTSLLPAVLTKNGGDVCFGKSPPSAGHISHPADGSDVGEIGRAINDRPYGVKVTF